MALPVLASQPNDKTVSEVLEENNQYLEEIQETLQVESNIIEGQYEILEDQLEIDKENQRLAQLEADNEELRARRLESKMNRPSGPSIISSTSGGRDLNTDGFLDRIKSTVAAGLPLAIASALQGGGLIGIGEVFGDSIGSFLGDNVGYLLNELGVDPAFADKIDNVLTERTGSIIRSGGWSKLLFGKARYGIIADLLAGFLGLPSLTEEGTVKKIQEEIEGIFGEKVAGIFGSTADVVAGGVEGLFAGSMLGGLFGRKGRIVGAVAGLLIDYLDLTSLADPAKREEIINNVFEEIPVILGTVGAGAAALVGGRRMLRGTATVAGAAYRGGRGAARRLQRGGATAPDPVAPAPITAQQAARNLSPRQLEAAGLRRVGTGANAVIQRAGGQIASSSEILRAAEASAVSKFPRIAKLLRFPGIGSIISLGELYLILNDDTITKDEKIARVAGLLGGIGGSMLGAIAGTAIGAPGGPLAILTGSIGGIGGYFAGDALVYHMARYFLDDTDDELPAGVVDSIAPEMQEPPTLNPTTSASSSLPGNVISMSSPTSGFRLGGFESTVSGGIGLGSTESSARSGVNAGNIEISNPNTVRIIPQVNTNQISPAALSLSDSSGNVNVASTTVNNITNNSSTSVDSGGAGSSSLGSAKTYNPDAGFGAAMNPAYA